MRKAGAALLGLLILSGCALPVPIRLASWAIDGISLLATQKSVADHGISLIAERDCAMWRSLAGDEVCVENDAGSSTAVAEAEAQDGSDSVQSLASFETAAGTPASGPVAYATPRVVVWLKNRRAGETDPAAASWQIAAGDSDEPALTNRPRRGMLEEIDPAAASFPAAAVEGEGGDGEALGAGRMAWPGASGFAEAEDPTVIAAAAMTGGGTNDARVRAAAGARRVAASADSLVAKPARGVRAPRGIYFVVGSFRSLANARRLARRHVSLAPLVMSADMDGTTVFRVMVGPFTRRQSQDGRRRVIQAGIFDAWAISLDGEDWRMARTVADPAREVASTAGVADGR